MKDSDRCNGTLGASHNTANTDTRSFMMDHSARSIAFASGHIGLFIGGKSNGGVCQNVIRHAA